MDQGIGMLDSVGTTYEPLFAESVPTLSHGVVAYSSSTPVLPDTSTGIPMQATLPTPTSSTLYLPRPPHIAIPTPSPSVSEAADDRLDIGAIVGIVLGVLAFVVATGAIIFYLCRRKRLSSETKKQASRGSWIDLESKNIRYDLASLPSYDEVKAPALGASAHYTKYVPRTLGRLSPISQMVPPTFDLIKDHHLFSDLLTDPTTPPARGTGQNTSPDYLNDIELTVTPFDTHFDR
ncbi:hypothetical protein C0989_005895 [Termitomyces sp. Mn162]|nr:hypothetical protein C0989_005895 [Termitomyces sp. Mn162]